MAADPHALPNTKSYCLLDAAGGGDMGGGRGGGVGAEEFWVGAFQAAWAVKLLGHCARGASSRCHAMAPPPWPSQNGNSTESSEAQRQGAPEAVTWESDRIKILGSKRASSSSRSWRPSEVLGDSPFSIIKPQVPRPRNARNHCYYCTEVIEVARGRDLEVPRRTSDSLKTIGLIIQK